MSICKQQFKKREREREKLLKGFGLEIHFVPGETTLGIGCGQVDSFQVGAPHRAQLQSVPACCRLSASKLQLKAAGVQVVFTQGLKEHADLIAGHMTCPSPDLVRVHRGWHFAPSVFSFSTLKQQP